MAYHGLKGLEVGVLKRALFAAQSFETYPDGSECYPFVPSQRCLYEKKTFVSLYNIWRRSKLSTDLLSLELFLSIAKREGLYMSVLFLFVIQWALNKWFFSCGKECLSFCQLPKLNLLELKQESDVKMVGVCQKNNRSKIHLLPSHLSDNWRYHVYGWIYSVVTPCPLCI